MVLEPDISPVAKVVVVAGIDAGCPFIQEHLQFFSGFFFCLSVYGFVVGLTVVFVANHHSALPTTVCPLANHTFTVRSFSHVTPSSGNKGVSHFYVTIIFYVMEGFCVNFSSEF